MLTVEHLTVFYGDVQALWDVSLQVEQGEIGEIIGMSRESTNKQLRDWQDRKWIKLERGGISVLQPNALQTIAERGRQTD